MGERVWGCSPGIRCVRSRAGPGNRLSPVQRTLLGEQLPGPLGRINLSFLRASQVLLESKRSIKVKPKPDLPKMLFVVMEA